MRRYVMEWPDPHARKGGRPAFGVRSVAGDIRLGLPLPTPYTDRAASGTLVRLPKACFCTGRTQSRRYSSGGVPFPWRDEDGWVEQGSDAASDERG